MEETNKIDTQSKTYRMPVDVLEMLDRWAEEQKISATQVLINVLRASAEDEKAVLQRAVVLQEKAEDVLQSPSVLRIPLPRNRDGLAEAHILLQDETRGRISINDQISALGVARARVYKTTPEYQARKKELGDRFQSPYEDEKRLAENLSAADAAHYTPKMREKSEK